MQKRQTRFFYVGVVLLCALDHGQIYRIYGSNRRHVTRLTQVGVSRESRDMSLSQSYPLSHSFSVWAKKSPDKCHAHALWRRPGPARIGLAKSNSRLSTHTQLERTSRTGPQLNKS